MISYIPERSHFIRLSFDPQAGHEQMGTRSALVVSHTKFNHKLGFVFVCPVSNTKRQSPFYVVLSAEVAVTGVIMTDQLCSLDYRASRAEFISKCPDSLFQEVLRRIKPIVF